MRAYDFIRELRSIRKRTCELSERVNFVISINERMQSVQRIFHVVFFSVRYLADKFISNKNRVMKSIKTVHILTEISYFVSLF